MYAEIYLSIYPCQLLIETFTENTAKKKKNLLFAQHNGQPSENCLIILYVHLILHRRCMFMCMCKSYNTTFLWFTSVGSNKLTNLPNWLTKPFSSLTFFFACLSLPACIPFLGFLCYLTTTTATAFFISSWFGLVCHFPQWVFKCEESAVWGVQSP